MHEHNICNHKLEFCQHCDVVYCISCKQEWKKYSYNYTYTNVPYIPYTGGSGTMPLGEGQLYNCGTPGISITNHTHNG